MKTPTDVDLDRIPAELRDELAEMLPAALTICRAFEDLADRFDDLAARWNTRDYPQLADQDRPGDLDAALMEASGFTALDLALRGAFDAAELDVERIERAAGGAAALTPEVRPVSQEDLRERVYQLEQVIRSMVHLGVEIVDGGTTGTPAAGGDKP